MSADPPVGPQADRRWPFPASLSNIRSMRSWLFAILVSASLTTCAAAQAPRALFELEPYRKTVALRARIAGQTGLFAFDTAGGVSIVTPAFAQRIGCRPWGRMTGFRMMGDRLDMPFCQNVVIRIGEREFGAPVLGVFDIMSLFPKDAQPIDGLIALDLFSAEAITIDFPSKQLVIESEKSLARRIRSATEVPARIAREVQGRALAVNVGVPSSKGLVWMELDSGNGGTILISRPYAALFGLDPAKEGPQDVDFSLAGKLRVTGRAFAPDMILDGNIGMPFLGTTVVSLDLRAGRVWISQPAGGGAAKTP
jgi:hypothetical protein